MTGTTSRWRSLGGGVPAGWFMVGGNIPAGGPFVNDLVVALDSATGLGIPSDTYALPQRVGQGALNQNRTGAIWVIDNTGTQLSVYDPIHGTTASITLSASLDPYSLTVSRATRNAVAFSMSGLLQTYSWDGTSISLEGSLTQSSPPGFRNIYTNPTLPYAYWYDGTPYWYVVNLETMEIVYTYSDTHTSGYIYGSGDSGIDEDTNQLAVGAYPGTYMYYYQISDDGTTIEYTGTNSTLGVGSPYAACNGWLYGPGPGPGYAVSVNCVPLHDLSTPSVTAILNAANSYGQNNVLMNYKQALSGDLNWVYINCVYGGVYEYSFDGLGAFTEENYWPVPEGYFFAVADG